MSFSVETIAEQLRATQLAYRRVASELADRAQISIIVELLPMSKETKEAVHGGQHIGLRFRGPLHGKWTQRRQVSLDENTQKHFAKSRDRCIGADMLLMPFATLGLATRKEDFVQASTGILAKWNATELTLTSSLVDDKPFVIKLFYQQDTNALESVEVSYDSDSIPAAVGILRAGIIMIEETRLTTFTLTEAKEEPEPEVQVAPVNIASKKRPSFFENGAAPRRHLILE